MGEQQAAALFLYEIESPISSNQLVYISQADVQLSTDQTHGFFFSRSTIEAKESSDESEFANCDSFFEIPHHN
jgi:hypothetical protein